MSPGHKCEPELTLAIIVRDDAERLARTLSAVAPAVDEIVICDSSEHDDAAEVSARYGAKVIRQPWFDSFSMARNECLRHVHGHWILWLDAGETMEASDIQQLRAHLKDNPTPKAYMLLVKTPPTNGALDGEQVARVRLVPQHAELRFVGRVRESLIPALEKLGIPCEGLPFRIHRASEEQERTERRVRRNIELADLELREFGPQPRLLNCLAEAFQLLGERQQAAAYYQHSIDRGVPGSSELLEAYYGLITLEEQAQSHHDAKMQMCLRALEAFPLDMQLLCAMGGFLQTAGRWDLALRSYETAYRYGQIHAEVWHMDHLRGVAAECYALSLQLQNKLDEACAVLQEELQSDPSSQRIRQQLLEMLVKRGQREQALQLVNRDWTGCNQEAMRSAVRGATLAASQNWIAARAYLQVAHQAGCRDTLCMRWLSITLLAAGAIDDARKILTEWSALEPQNVEPRRYLEALQGEMCSNTRESQTPSDRQLRIDAQTSTLESNRANALHSREISLES